MTNAAGEPDAGRRLSQVAGSVQLVQHAAVPGDTDPEAYALLVDRWRSMTIDERVALIEQMCDDVDVLARASIVATNPTASDVEIAYELARRRYGRDLADAAYEKLLVLKH